MNEGSRSNANSEQRTCENTTEQYVRTCFGSSSENKLQLISEFLYTISLHCTCSAVLLVDQSSPDFFRRTREESLSITCLFDYGYLYPFRRYGRSNFEVVRNRPKSCTFLSLHL